MSNNIKGNKDCVISVRCSEGDKTKLKRLAEKAGKKDSEYILSRCIPSEQRKQTIRKCKEKVLICHRKRQDDINKIRRIVNGYKEKPECESIVKELTAIIDELEDDLYAEVNNSRKKS